MRDYKQTNKISRCGCTKAARSKRPNGTLGLMDRLATGRTGSKSHNNRCGKANVTSLNKQPLSS